MRGKFIIFLIAIVTLVFAVIMYREFQRTQGQSAERAKAAQLIVWTYSSFMDNYGPASALKAAFERDCLCTVVFVDAGGTPVAIEKLKLDPSRRVDVLLGIDLLSLPQIMSSVRLQKLDKVDVDWVREVAEFIYPRFIPYNWSPMGFIYRADKTTPAKSWEDFKKSAKNKSVSVQDPTLSAPGRVFQYWIASLVGIDNYKSELTSVNEKVYSYSPSWTSAYGLFRSQQVEMVFSYLTSLIYHWEVDKDKNYQFMSFSEGHPLQIEYAAVPENCWNCNVAKKFVSFLVTSEAQKILSQKNYMLPVRQDVRDQLGGGFQDLPRVELIQSKNLDVFSQNEIQILKDWRAAR